jgi:hypothetical protein
MLVLVRAGDGRPHVCGLVTSIRKRAVCLSTAWFWLSMAWFPARGGAYFDLVHRAYV